MNTCILRLVISFSIFIVASLFSIPRILRFPLAEFSTFFYFLTSPALPDGGGVFPLRPVLVGQFSVFFEDHAADQRQRRILENNC